MYTVSFVLLLHHRYRRIASVIARYSCTTPGSDSERAGTNASRESTSAEY
jgi:hypothetical protein